MGAVQARALRRGGVMHNTDGRDARRHGRRRRAHAALLSFQFHYRVPAAEGQAEHELHEPGRSEPQHRLPGEVERVEEHLARYAHEPGLPSDTLYLEVQGTPGHRVRRTGHVTDRVLPALYDLLGGLGEKEFAPRRRALLAHAAAGCSSSAPGPASTSSTIRPPSRSSCSPSRPPGCSGRATRRARTAGFPVRAVQTPAERLPFEDASFDTVVATLVLCSVDDQDRVLAEVRRVLRPDGRFLFIEHVRSDDANLARWQDRLERPWGVIGFGCHPNRATLGRIEAAGFELEALEADENMHAPRLVRPLITGRAAAHPPRLR